MVGHCSGLTIPVLVLLCLNDWIIRISLNHFDSIFAKTPNQYLSVSLGLAFDLLY